MAMIWVIIKGMLTGLIILFCLVMVGVMKPF